MTSFKNTTTVVYFVDRFAFLNCCTLIDAAQKYSHFNQKLSPYLLLLYFFHFTLPEMAWELFVDIVKMFLRDNIFKKRQTICPKFSTKIIGFFVCTSEVLLIYCHYFYLKYDLKERAMTNWQSKRLPLKEMPLIRTDSWSSLIKLLAFFVISFSTAQTMLWYLSLRVF